MATEDRHASDSNNPSTPKAGEAHGAVAAPLSAQGVRRRRFAKAGAGATGVLLTLYSQPGMACTNCGVSMSTMASAVGQHRTVAQLSHHGQAPVCSGRPPQTWCSTSSWPHGYYPGDYFHKYFACSHYSAYYGQTCKQILSGASCDSSQMACYMMAAYLNVVSGRVNFLTVETLQSTWNEWVSKGYYEPMAGQRWYADQIVDYLKKTMD